MLHCITRDLLNHTKKMRIAVQNLKANNQLLIANN
jgi:hypothetical protein